MAQREYERVVITGMGWVTPLGCDISGVWEKLLNGESGAGAITRFDTRDFTTRIGSEVKDFAPEGMINK